MVVVSTTPTEHDVSWSSIPTWDKSLCDPQMPFKDSPKDVLKLQNPKLKYSSNTHSSPSAAYTPVYHEDR